MRHYMPAYNHATLVRRLARRHQVEVRGRLLALLGMILVAGALASFVLFF